MACVPTGLKTNQKIYNLLHLLESLHWVETHRAGGTPVWPPLPFSGLSLSFFLEVP